MRQAQAERHVLILEGKQRRHFILDAQTYSIGRDRTNAIVIKDASISRKHAMLVRVPDSQKTHHTYRLIDGDFEGKPSGNGTFVNQNKTSSHTLQDGDLIRLGPSVKAKYKITDAARLPINFQKAVQSHKIQSNAIDSKQTIVGELIMIDEMLQPMRDEVVNDSKGLENQIVPANKVEVSDESNKSGLFAFVARLFSKIFG